MEEVKEKTMENVKPEEKKLSYQELEAVAVQLSDQARKMQAKLEEANMINVFSRLKFLFKVVEFEESFSGPFVKKCIEEIENLITIPENTEEESDKPEE